jgi:glycosyltransferase involved in cell wall biosynthesis
VANLSYAPNEEAALCLVQEIAPRLAQRLPDHGPVRVLLAGANPSPAVAALADYPGVELHPNVPDLGDLYRQADLALIPLFAGGGTRIKVLEAFAWGVPVVATPIALEGIDAADGEHFLAADAFDELAGACRACLTDTRLAARLAGAARRLVEERYTREVVAEKIRAALRGR